MRLVAGAFGETPLTSCIFNAGRLRPNTIIIIVRGNTCDKSIAANAGATFLAQRYFEISQPSDRRRPGRCFAFYLPLQNQSTVYAVVVVVVVGGLAIRASPLGIWMPQYTCAWNNNSSQRCVCVCARACNPGDCNSDHANTATRSAHNIDRCGAGGWRGKEASQPAESTRKVKRFAAAVVGENVNICVRQRQHVRTYGRVVYAVCTREFRDLRPTI